MILSHAVVPFPTELVTGAAGYVYGFALSLPLLLSAWLLSAILSYWLAERFGRGLARRAVGARRLRRAETAVGRGGAGPLLAVRLIPLIPFNCVSYAAGIVRVPLARFSWTTAVGMAPLMALVAYLGSRLRTPDLADPRIWVAVGAVVAGVVAGQLLGTRRRRHA